jgi:hypothetical protein
MCTKRVRRSRKGPSRRPHAVGRGSLPKTPATREAERQLAAPNVLRAQSERISRRIRPDHGDRALAGSTGRDMTELRVCRPLASFLICCRFPHAARQRGSEAGYGRTAVAADASRKLVGFETPAGRQGAASSESRLSGTFEGDRSQRADGRSASAAATSATSISESVDCGGGLRPTALSRPKKEPAVAPGAAMTSR